MLGERKILTLGLSIGAVVLTLINLIGLSLEKFLIEVGILLLSLLFGIAGFLSLYLYKEKLGWKLITIFFSITLINTVVLFYLEPRPNIIMLSLFSAAGYILVLDQIHGGKMIFDDLQLGRLDDKSKLGVLDESPKQVRKRLDAFRQSHAHWEPSHLDEPKPLNESRFEHQNINVYEEPSVEIYETAQRIASMPAMQEQASTVAPSIIEDVPKPVPSSFVAALHSPRFHEPNCHWVEHLEKEDLLTFSTEDEARAKGLVPCTCVR